MAIAKKQIRHLCGLLIVLSFQGCASGQERARDLGVPFLGQTGPYNSITDVTGVEVGHTTLISGEGALVRGEGPVRTGVTAIHPRGKDSTSPVFGGWFALNGSGEMTGTTWLKERGLIDGPILITNTHSVGVVRDAAVEWMVDKGWSASWHAPIAAETYDGILNDINGFHVTRTHALDALASAHPGPVTEGAVGGGTGMMCHRFKGGIGTASRTIETAAGTYTLGVLVQCNYGRRNALKQIAGIPASGLHDAPMPCYRDEEMQQTGRFDWPVCGENDSIEPKAAPDGSIIVIIATDAPFLPNQLTRIAKRPSLGLGRLGATSTAGSGDIFLAFSTAANNNLDESEVSRGLEMFPNLGLSPFFEATIQATEEAIVNAMLASETMEGADGIVISTIPKDRLKQIVSEYLAANDQAR